MKNLRKFSCLLLVMTMVFALAATAFAADATTYTITITNEVNTHIYEAYQIFAGDLAEDNGTKILSNITWGSGVSEAGQTEMGSAAEKAKSLSSEADAKAFAKVVAQYLVDTAAETSSVSGNAGQYSYTISGLAPGYYLIKDKTDSTSSDGSSHTEYILQVVGDVSVNAKDSSISVVKKVDDKNDSDSAEDETVWQDSADHDIGDAVPFQITTTLPGDFTAYETYTLILHDKQSAGLTFQPTTVKAYVVNGETTTEISTEAYTVVTSELNDECTFEVRFTNLRKIEGATNNSQIVVTYTSLLNENAVLGSAGNPNTVYGEFSNDYYEGTTDKTPSDTVIVFTYQVTANKYANQVNEENKLTGAGFTLYKYDADADGDDKWVAVGEEITGENMSSFTWKGLDDGQYKLVETTTPAGFNTIAPILFTITAEHSITADEPKLTSLTGGDLFTGTVSTGALTTDVVNTSGSSLPSTGGIGTTIFYIIGGVLVLAAIVLLVTKKRMSNQG